MHIRISRRHDGSEVKRVRADGGNGNGVEPIGKNWSACRKRVGRRAGRRGGDDAIAKTVPTEMPLISMAISATPEKELLKTSTSFRQWNGSPSLIEQRSIMRRSIVYSPASSRSSAAGKVLRASSDKNRCDRG